MHCRLQRESQYLRYVNRFGPGAVIYWFGFLESLADADADILLLEAFPEAGDIMQLPKLPVPGSAMLPRLLVPGGTMLRS
jgi:hypothetical protein